MVKYKHLVQKKNFCGPTCIQMVLFRRGIWLEQERIASDLGVCIDENDKNLYENDFKAFASDNERVGILLVDFLDESRKKILNEYGLDSEVVLVSQIKDVGKFLSEKLQEDTDIIANFWLKPIKGENFGHFVLIEDYDSEKKKVKLCDPNFESISRWECELSRMVEGMSKKWTGTERGLLLLQKKGTSEKRWEES